MQKIQLGTAEAKFSGEVLSVSTGRVEREWIVTKKGLFTTMFRLAKDPTRNVAGDSDLPAWHLYHLLRDDDIMELEDIVFSPVRNSPLTADHLRVEVCCRYPRPQLQVVYVVDVYPASWGIRTSLRLKYLYHPVDEQVPSFAGPAWSDALTFHTPFKTMEAAGYYNDTQHRNYPTTPLLLEQKLPMCEQSVDWANIFLGYWGNIAFAMVKESPKCVNQPSLDTGCFEITPQHIRNTGLALHTRRRTLLPSEAYHESWGTWTILTPGDKAELCHAIRDFDRQRFPFRAQRDTWIMANTWGSRGAGNRSRSACEQSNILRELESCADLGIEILQIDDGWQCPPDPENPFDVDWMEPNPERFPDGWTTVRQAADKKKIALGLWFPWKASTDAILNNIRNGGFRRIKLDFVNTSTYEDFHGLMAKARAIIEATANRCAINWDLTERSARVGYFTGREYGNVYLANRPAPPPDIRRLDHVAYIPHLHLRDAWHLAHYLNLNQFQLSIQNHERIPEFVSDACRHPQTYGFAIAMMGMPLFFQETQFLSDSARAALRPLIHRYKQVRDTMLACFVEPLGGEPDNRSWVIFHHYQPDAGNGFLSVFRELQNRDEKGVIRIPRLAGRTLECTDLVTGERRVLRMNQDGETHLAIPQSGSFLWWQYRSL